MLYIISFLFPNIAYADFNSFMTKVYGEIFNPTIRLLVVVAFAYFFYGVVVFLSNMDSDEKKTTGKNHMIWGIVGLTVMLGVWGIMSILINTFDIKGIRLNGGGGAYDDSGNVDPIVPDLDSGDDNNYGIGNSNIIYNPNDTSSELINSSNADSLDSDLTNLENDLNSLDNVNFEGM